jgi:L-ascorbate metabolism protein UlaG (beta-lactamase superfamily)
MDALRKLHASIIQLVTLVLFLSACTGTPATPGAQEPVITPSAAAALVPQVSPQMAGGKAAVLLQDITWLRSKNVYGHTAIRISMKEMEIYIDPVDLVGLEDLPKADLLLITHNHPDHFSPRTIAALSDDNTTIVSIESILRSFAGTDTFAVSLAKGALVDGVEIKAVPAYNDNHPQAMGWVGFLLTINGVRIYCSGDTGLTPEMRALSGTDIAVLTVRSPYSLSGADAAEFARLVGPTYLIPIHWMPDDDTYGDAAEIESLRQNMPSGTELVERTPLPDE